MNIVCLDLEGVLTPEIWIAFSKATGIDELKLTTRDVPDYDLLMQGRIGILARHGLKLADIQAVIAGMDLLEGARDMLDRMREITQVVILSDTFEQFAKPLMKKLGWPTLFCNRLVVDQAGMISSYQLRQKEGKKMAVLGLTGLGYTVHAAGDSYNDLAMLKCAGRGVLFRPPKKIIKDYPQFPVSHNHRELYDFLMDGVQR